MSKQLLHTPEGVRDIYGAEYYRKLKVESILSEAIERFGYDRIQTPTFEYFDVFSKEIGTTPSKELYKFFDKEGNTLVLRPDFTPSIARCAAKYYMEETSPVRFCYLGNTFTNTSNLQGKLKEVTQVGAELISDGSVEADAEMLSMVIAALKSTGLEHFQVSIGQTEYFKGLCQEAGLDEETECALQEAVCGKNLFAAQAILTERKVREPYAQMLLKIVDVAGNITSLSEAKAFVQNERSIKAIERLEELYRVLSLYGVAQYVSFDLGMLSKYHYYSGMIFKVYTYGIGDALVKGGRYDRLLKQFGKDAPAVGFVIVIDDLLEALKRQQVQTDCQKAKQQLYYNADNFAEKLRQAQELRRQGIAAELIPEK